MSKIRDIIQINSRVLKTMYIDAVSVGYFRQGFPYDDMLKMLFWEHGVEISIRTLHRFTFS